MHTKAVADDWFVGFMEGLKARFWRVAAEPRADDDAAALAGLLELPPGARVLDAPCGSGRIAVRLAERGLDLTGIDNSPTEIELARRAAAKHGVDARFEVRDVRDAPEEDFDALVVWGNSFGYMPHAETLEHLAACRRALRDGGRLVLDTSVLAESILPSFRAELDYDLGEVRMQATQRYDAPRSRLIGEMRFTAPDAEPEEAVAVHHVYTLAELLRMLGSAGFEVDELIGDLAERRPFELGDGRLVLLGRAV